jgi:hypothetical protein
MRHPFAESDTTAIFPPDRFCSYCSVLSPVTRTSKQPLWPPLAVRHSSVLRALHRQRLRLHDVRGVSVTRGLRSHREEPASRHGLIFARECDQGADCRNRHGGKVLMYLFDRRPEIKILNDGRRSILVPLMTGRPPILPGIASIFSHSSQSIRIPLRIDKSCPTLRRFSIPQPEHRRERCMRTATPCIAKQYQGRRAR